MSAFNQAAPAITGSVAGIFGIASSNPAALKAGVVLGISALEGQSFGHDAKMGLNLSM